jgi:hypothetical protein
MRIAAAIAALAVVSAAAQGLEDFHERAVLALPTPSPLYRIALPESVYRDGRADLGDVRVFNARGEPVPIALAPEPEVIREASPPVQLAAFPITSLEPAQVASQVTVRLADGTLLALDAGGKSAAMERRVAAYVLDASALKEPLRALDIDWEVLPERETIRVRVESSDDLRTWTQVAGPVTLLRVDQAGRRLEQSRVPLDGVRAKYLRLVVVDVPFTLRSARAEFQERARPSDLMVKRVSGQPGKAGEATSALGARFPVEAVRVVPAEANAVIAATLFVRDAPDATASWVAQATFYRLAREGGEVETPPAHIRRRAARYWIVRTDPEKGGYGATLPQLEVHWRAAQLVFVARGEGPYTLAFGNRQARSALLPIASVIPGYEAHAETKLPEASAAAVTHVRSARDDWPTWLQDISPRKLALWALLVGAVMLLAFMAWRLHRASLPK